MTIRILYYSYLRDAVGHSEEEMVLPEGTQAGGAVDVLCGRYPKLSECRKNILLAIGVEWIKQDAPLKDGDTLLLMPPVQGGASKG